MNPSSSSSAAPFRHHLHATLLPTAPTKSANLSPWQLYEQAALPYNLSSDSPHSPLRHEDAPSV